VRALPGPRGALPGGRLIALRRHPETFLHLARRYGDVVSFTVGAQPVVLLSHPAHVEAVLETQQARFRKGWGPLPGGALGGGLIASEGEVHRRHRRALLPLFHGGRLPGYARSVVSMAEAMTDGWRVGEVIDLWDAMKKLTSGFVSRALLGVGEDRRRLFCEASELVTRQFSSHMSAWAGLARALDPRRWRLARALRRLDEEVYALIDERRAAALGGEDLVSILVRQGELDDQEIRDEVVTLFVAGYETIALALTWSGSLVATHPAARHRLWEEVDAIDPETPLGSAHLARLPYARAVLSEAMRLFPPKWMLGRLAIEEVDLGDATISPGTLVLVSPYVVHRDPRFFAEPERFMPERWLSRPTPAPPKFAYFPFGAGSRRCIGEGLAWMEGTLAAAVIARRWALEPRAGRPRLDPRITLRPRSGMAVRLVRRPEAR